MGITTLIFGEPDTFNYSYDYIVIDINNEMLKKIESGGTAYEDCSSNAYVFGKLYDIDDYRHAGHHDVRHHQTGLIEKLVAKKKYRDGDLTCDFEDFCDAVKYNDPT